VEITQSQQQALSLISKQISGNPYPGKDFTLERGKKFFEVLQTQEWKPENLEQSIDQLRDIIQPPKE
jgi:hypothetical protein